MRCALLHPFHLCLKSTHLLCVRWDTPFCSMTLQEQASSI